MSKVPLTVRGAEKLREELTVLKTIKRPAREQQSFIEGRIKDIEGKLSHAQIIDVTEMDAGGRVIFGATVVVYDVGMDEEITYKIVGEDEADIETGLISVNSPIARAFIGKEVDDSVEVNAPGGTREFEIVDVRYEA
ncbi:transcription elongation factor GreA [Solemya elarraichensis gill symbiont]|uniref:Transcription elongation factor GreA n=1 Tax=Solemya elarraichensis gill symbiont TaxID=1918949 RepID=A0A1T2KZ13_9GAMM|nr:transcription elongation factor GreA [Solemya elarraichensis gill symbiont]OOZ38097.1 transcription elongation factor GreA [Solemya elarraichensis gill symbiont]